MSIVSEHASNASSQSFDMIGVEVVSVNGTDIDCILNEVDFAKDFGNVGFEPTKRLQAVCKTVDLPDGDLLKKIGTARGETFRVEGIRKGGTFTTLTLEEIHKA